MVMIVSQQAVLAFRLGQQHYALPIEHVIEVAGMVALTTSPDAAPEIIGMANRHGYVIPVLDLRRAFKLPEAQIDISTLFIVVESKQQRVGLVVDEVFQVKYVEIDKFAATPGTGRFITHVATDGDNVFQMVDLKPILENFLD